MRRLLKFLHTMSTIGITGGLAAYMMVLAYAPPVESLEAYAAMRESLAMISKWLILPSMLIVVLSGLLALFTANVVLAIWRPRFGLRGK